MMPISDIRELVRAGMTIGFHTLRHPLLPLLADAELDRALTEGRDALASAAGTVIEFLAYPYGQADARVAEAARRAGYTAAFATGDRAIGRPMNRFLVSRWQPGFAAAEHLLAEAAFRLMLPAEGRTRLPASSHAPLSCEPTPRL